MSQIKTFKTKEEALELYPIMPKDRWGPTTKDLTNMRYGKLTCICRVQKAYGKADWLCQCDCGNFIIVRSTNLYSGNSKSCGCVAIEKSKNSIKIAAEAAWAVTTEKLEPGQVFGPHNVIYLGPSHQKDSRGFRKDWFKCPLCGNKFLSIRANIKNGHTSSCGCSYSSTISSGERKIISILEKEHIIYEREKTLSAPRISRCRYDFYLPELNILLEYNGEQHYEYINYFFKNLSDFKHRQELDRLKISAALANNIPIYCIPYWEFDNIQTFSDLIQKKFLAHSKFHNDEAYRHQKSKLIK